MKESKETQEIIPLNDELYSDFTVEQLEERLEMAPICVIQRCGSDDGTWVCMGNF